MKKSYNIQREGGFLHGDVGVQFSLTASIEKAISNRGLWGHSKSFTSQAIHCILCEIPQDGANLLLKAKIWIEAAIKSGEKARHFEETSNKFHQHLIAIIRWLNDGIHDQGSLDIWFAEEMKWFRNHPDRLSTADLGLGAVTFLNAGGYEEYLALAAPGELETVKCSGANEKQMALTLAVQAQTQKFPEEKVQATVKKFLDRQVGEWLNNGHAIRAAEWMKVIYWKRGETGLSPFDAVRKCLDHVEH